MHSTTGFIIAIWAIVANMKMTEFIVMPKCHLGNGLFFWLCSMITIPAKDNAAITQHTSSAAHQSVTHFVFHSENLDVWLLGSVRFAKFEVDRSEFGWSEVAWSEADWPEVGDLEVGDLEVNELEVNELEVDELEVNELMVDELEVGWPVGSSPVVKLEDGSEDGSGLLDAEDASPLDGKATAILSILLAKEETQL